MGARCWACEVGVPALSGLDVPRPPIASCRACGAFACEAHAEHDAATGRWLCVQSVADILLSSAGIDDVDPVVPDIRFQTVAEYRHRLPVTHAAVHEHLDAAPHTAYPSMIPMAAEVEIVSCELLEEAILLGTWMLTPRTVVADPNQIRVGAVLPGALARLVRARRRR